VDRDTICPYLPLEQRLGFRFYFRNVYFTEEAMLRICAVALSAIVFTAYTDAIAASTVDIDPVNAASVTTGSAKPSEAVVIKLQVLLDRAGFSPGEISGRLDENTKKAISAFEAQQRLTIDGKVNPNLWMAITATSEAPVLMEYAVTGEDVQGPFLKKLPSKMEDMKDLERLSYTSPRQGLSEKFHMNEALLSTLNRGKSFDKIGTTIVVANVASDQTRKKVVRIEVDKPRRLVRAFGDNNELIAVFPASIGSTEKPAPSGTFKVTSVAHNPTYRYNPSYAFKGVKAKQPFTIRPGPNNPVGTVWIGLSAEGYGIHGTPDPSKVGKTASHGCIRLTNWDAEKLAAMVKRGVPVAFLEMDDAPQAFAEIPHTPRTNNASQRLRARQRH
jgi:lipoprotein-anchoring transpeptidase ErfK/SrfK